MKNILKVVFGLDLDKPKKSNVKKANNVVQKPNKKLSNKLDEMLGEAKIQLDKFDSEFKSES